MQKSSCPALLTGFVILCLLAGYALPVRASETLTQRDWMVQLVDTLGLSFGLPDTPEDSDYLGILQGKRTLRVEAEDTFQPDDLVSTKDFRTFGPFSGKGWVSGIGKPTTARLRFILPRGGVYRLEAAVRLAGHHLRIGDRDFSADGGGEFTPVQLGEAVLRPGPQEVQVTIPPNGGIDYLELSAEPLTAIEPMGGWEPDQPLTLDVMAETIIRALGLEPLLPPAGSPVHIEAETALAGGTVDVSKANHLGLPEGGYWVRAGARTTDAQFDFSLPADGVYDVSLRGAAEAPVTVRLNGGREIRSVLPPFLEEIPLGTFLLKEGKNRISVALPPRAGIDYIVLHPRNASSGAVRRLAGLPAQGTRPTPDQVNALLALLGPLAPAD